MTSTATDRLSGLSTSVAVKAPCRLKTTGNHALSGLTSIDGVTPVEGDRILVASQTDATENGIYNAASTAWSRAKDFDGTRDAVGGTQLSITSGATLSGSYWRIVGDGPVVIGTDEIEFEAGVVDSAGAISFTQSGSGAAASTVQDELRRIAVTPQQFSGFHGDGATDDYTALAAAVAAADAGAKVLRLPPVAVDYVLGSPLTIPDGMVVLVEHRIIGLGTAGYFNVGSSTIIFDGGEFRNCQLKLTGGSPKIFGFRYTGYNFSHAILANTANATYTDVEIVGLYVKDANFGFARLGGASHVANGSSMRNVKILDGEFTNLAGDAIQFDIGISDDNILVANHVIDTINAGSDPGHARTNWGNGVSFSGLSYDPTYPDSKTIRNFTIHNIHGYRMRKLIHVECGARFRISDIHGEEINETFSPDSGIDCAHIAIYGSTDFTIDGVHGDGSVEKGGILLLDGTTSGVVAPCQNFALRNVDLYEGPIHIQQGNDSSLNVVENVLIRNASFLVDGRAGQLTLSNVTVRRPVATGVALNLNMNTSRAHEATTSRLDVNNVDARDETGAISRTLSISSVSTSKANNLLGDFAVASLPASAIKSERAYATNGRNGGEGAASGTGTPVFYSGSAWRVPGVAGAVAA